MANVSLLTSQQLPTDARCIRADELSSLPVWAFVVLLLTGCRTMPFNRVPPRRAAVRDHPSLHPRVPEPQRVRRTLHGGRDDSRLRVRKCAICPRRTSPVVTSMLREGSAVMSRLFRPLTVRLWERPDNHFKRVYSCQNKR